MSITQEARDALGAKVVGHTDVRATVELPSGLIKTDQRHTVSAKPSTIQGDTRCGAIMATQPDDDTDAQQEEQQLQEAAEPAPRPRRKSRSRKQDQQDDSVAVNVTMPGFGTVPTSYRHFDVGAGVLRIGISGQSWIPAPASRNEDGSFTNVLTFDRAPGRRYVHVGLEFVHAGVRSLVLVEIPQEE